MCGSKWPKSRFWTAHNAFLDPKNQNFKNSRTRFLVHPTRMLHTKNQLPRCYTAQIKWGGSFFTLKSGYPFLAKNRYFRPILGHFFRKIWYIWAIFVVLYDTFHENHLLNKKNPPKMHFSEKYMCFWLIFCSFFIQENISKRPKPGNTHLTSWSRHFARRRPFLIP